MDRPENKKRLESIFAQLVKISNGNFSYQIDRSDKNDVLEALAFLTNSASEEIKDAFRHQAFINLPNSYHFVVQLFFEVNESGQITQTNPEVEKLLGYGPKTLHNTPFAGLLHKDAKKSWKKVWKALQRTPDLEMTLDLSFIEKSGLEFPAHCQIIGLPGNQKSIGRVIVTAFDMVNKQAIKEKQVKRKLERRLQSLQRPSHKTEEDMSVLLPCDMDNLRNAKQYIMDHLDKPLPSIKTLAHLAGTNEYKFKKGFKELIGMTPFQYQKHMRLRRAYVLIENSNKTISAIAKIVGFKKGNHLAREFKKRYGFSPTALRRS